MLADRDLQAYDMVNRLLSHTIIHFETVHNNNNVYIWCYIGGRLLIAIKDLNVCTIQYAENGLSFFEVGRIDICSFIRVNPSSLTVCLKCGASLDN